MGEPAGNTPAPSTHGCMECKGIGKRNKKVAVNGCSELLCVQDLRRGAVAPWATGGPRAERAAQGRARASGAVDGHGR